MPNIKDIAKLAGVSVTTVSRVLNNHPYVAEEKRARVQSVIDELDYSPNRSAMDLARGKTNTVGVIIPYNDHPWFDKIVNGILEAAFKNRYSVTLFPTGYDPKEEEKYLMRLKTKQVDGLIITSRANNWDVILPYLAYGPIIACEYVESKDVSCSYIDRVKAYRAGFQFLQDEGYKKVAFTAGRASRESTSTYGKINAYEQVFGPVGENRFLSECYTLEDGVKAGKHFFVEGKDWPDAIYANGDEVAAGVMYHVKELGLRVPEDVAILGQENLPIGKALEITTLDHNLKKLGENAFSIFEQGKLQRIKVEHELIRRKTV
ncbi:TPA: LacI family DNA-binding transcriptional regulator [Listeria innocua]|nr:LacI family DNA-binding transcriptional regulator [Listeria innocua]EAH4440339.1 LacI family DNA-binding transcriptional regulator [Listeria innocua]HBM3530716.1 LacI family DNA-binding transcriptional regulator [Listeria innocua]HBM3576871.1 LacI family DNA-binding transcriptional regulator [Listeria innocua]HBM3726150.1 LacI family DNA-binding transcriptional regulator [Listeria innocua]